MDAVDKIIATELKSRGFKKKAHNTYWRSKGDIINGVHDTKSRFSGQHLLDVGLIHPDAELESPTVPISWHVNRRIKHIVPDERLTAALNADIELPDEVRIVVLRNALDRVEEVLFNKITTREQLEELAMLPHKAQSPWIVPLSMVRYAFEKRGLPLPNYD